MYYIKCFYLLMKWLYLRIPTYLFHRVTMQYLVLKSTEVKEKIFLYESLSICLMLIVL